MDGVQSLNMDEGIEPVDREEGSRGGRLVIGGVVRMRRALFETECLYRVY